jgi:hypothetical protein
MHPITDSVKDTVNGMMLCVLIILLILAAVICVILN